MVLDYQEKCIGKIIMEVYINKILEEHNITGTATTLAANHLFHVNLDVKVDPEVSCSKI